MSRTSIFVAALTGSVVALALVAQATDFGSGFVALALGTVVSIALGGVFFLLSIAAFAIWAERTVAAYNAQLDPLFPSPITAEAEGALTPSS
jgi:hypothetical protein